LQAVTNPHPVSTEQYTTIHVQIAANYADMVMAELAELGYDAFLENDQGFEAYIHHNSFDPAHVNQIINRYAGLTPIHYTTSLVDKINWNEEWEKNYQPIFIDQRCMVRATFHQKQPGIQYDIIVNPKMSFGTGHHATTLLMLKAILELNCTEKKVLDAGCGTGILAILAAMKGAAHVLAVDIDAWAVENTTENCELNKVVVHVMKGTVPETNPTGPFQIILANINRNVLLNEMQHYQRLLDAAHGNLLLSGFYEADIPAITQKAQQYGLSVVQQTTHQQWACMQLVRTH